MLNEGSTPSEGREQVRSARGGGGIVLEKKKKRLQLQRMEGVWIGGGHVRDRCRRRQEEPQTQLQRPGASAGGPRRCASCGGRGERAERD